MQRRTFLASLTALGFSSACQADDIVDTSKGFTKKPVIAKPPTVYAALPKLAGFEDIPPDVQVKGLGGFIAFSPDSKMLAVASGPIEGQKESGICFLDPATGKRLPDFERTTGIKSGEDWPSALRFSPDGKYLAAGAKDYAALWETESGKRLPDIATEIKGSYSSLEFAPDSKSIFVCNRFFSIPDGRPQKRASDVAICYGVAFSPDGKLLAIRESGPITVWDWPERPKSRITFAPRSDWVSSGLQFVSTKILVSGFWRDALDQEYEHQFWDTEKGEPLPLFGAFKGRIDHFAPSSNGVFFAMPLQNQIEISLIRTVDLKLAANFRNTQAVHNEDPLMEVTFSAEGQYFAAARTHIVEIWRTEKLLEKSKR